MATARIATLIDAPDVIEVVRDQIADVIKAESAGQVVLAGLASKPDTSLWDLRVFSERQRTIEEWLNFGENPGQVPIVNVWTEGSATDDGKSSVAGVTTYRGRFNVDCYGVGHAQTDGGTGHIPGDLAAALTRDRAGRLVRNILAATQNRTLQLESLKIIWGSLRVVNFDFFIPTVEAHPVRDVRAVRFFTEVVYTESAPEPVASTLEFVSIDVTRDTISGELLAEVDIDYTA